MAVAMNNNRKFIELANIQMCRDLDEKQKETTKNWKTDELKEEHETIAGNHK